MKKFGEYLEESLAAEVKTEPKTMAAKQAQKMGLIYVGFGRYADNKGRVSYIVDNDRLVPFKGQGEVQKMYDKSTFMVPTKSADGKVIDKGAEIANQANQMAGVINRRTKEDSKILSAKDKELRAVDKQLSAFYQPNLFDDAERAAIDDYTGNSYYSVNRYLYKGHDDNIDAETADYLNSTIEALDSAFEGTEAPFSYTVYSGLSERYKAEKIVPDGEYIFRGYISTSLSHDIAIKGFTDSDEPVVLQIEVNKGNKAIYVDGISNIKGEYETLLPRGSKIKVVSGPHQIPKDVLGMDNNNDSPVNLFHCILIQDL